MMDESVATKYKSYLLVFLLPVIILLFVYVGLGIEPFGDKTLLTIDLHSQYISFYSYLRSVLLDGQSIFYSFSKNLGDNVFGLSAYYLFSPINLLVVFFSVEQLPFFVILVTLLKIGLSGITSFFYFDKRGNKSLSILLSASYALSAYSIVYQQNLMWLDAVIMLPLISYAIDRIVCKHTFTIYSLCLGLSICFCFYLGYMLCIYSVLYFCYRILAENKINLKIIKDFVFGSLISGGISACVLVPAYFSIVGNNPSVSDYSFNSLFSVITFFSGLLNGTYDTHYLMGGLPFIYCGIFPLLMLLYTLFSKLSKRKIYAVFLLLCFFLSFKITFFNTIWHGFATPRNFPFRYAFMFDFVWLMLLSENYYELSLKSYVKQILSVILMFGVLMLFVMERITLNLCLLNCLLILLVNLVLNCVKKESIKFLFLLSVVSFDLGANAYLTLTQMDYSLSENQNVLIGKNYLIDEIEDSDFYRVESTFNYNNNDPIALGYKGITHFSSTNKVFVDKFVMRLGYYAIGDIAANYGSGSTQFDDSLLGIKYILSNNYFPETYIQKQQGLLLNPTALNLAFLSSDSIKDIHIHDSDFFELKNSIFSSLTGKSKNLFNKLSFENENLVNLDVIDSSGSKFEFLPTAEDSLGKSEMKTIKFQYYFKNADTSNQVILDRSYISNSNDPVYLYLPVFEARDVDLYVNGQFVSKVLTDSTNPVYYLGEFKKDEVVHVELRSYEYDFFVSEMSIHSMDYQLLESSFQLLNEEVEYVEVDDNKVNISVNNISVDRNLLVLTIPYDDAWKVKLNNEVYNPIVILDTLMGIELAEGENVIEMTYIPKWFNCSLLISIVSWVLLFCYWIRKKKNSLN